MSDAVQTTETENKRRGRAPEHGPNDVITVVVEANPKRAGSKAHERFALYRTGMTVGEFEAAGGQPGEARADALRGHISIQKAAN